MKIEYAISSQSPARRSVPNEQARSNIVRLVYLLIALTFVEGALRKWIAPGLATPLIFLRDPVVLVTYAYAVTTGHLKVRGIGGFWLFVAVLASALGGIGYMQKSLPFWYWLLGVRNYWLYLPLVYVIAGSFRKDDFTRLFKFLIFLIPPYALLVYLQYNAGPNHVLNWGVAGDDFAAVVLGQDIVRPFGLFTYTGQNVRYSAVFLVFFAIYLLQNRFGLKSNIFTLVLLLSTIAVVTLTGSRQIYFLAAGAGGALIIGLLFAGQLDRTVQALFFVGLIGVIGLVAYQTFFPDMWQAMLDRFDRASSNEGSMFVRATENFLGFWFYSEFELVGEGIGLGSPSIANLAGIPALAYGEADNQRIMNELGVVGGSLLIFGRFLTAAVCFVRAVKIARLGDSSLLPLVGLLCVLLVGGQMTNSVLNSFAVWWLMGLALAYPMPLRKPNSRRRMSPMPPQWKNLHAARFKK